MKPPTLVPCYQCEEFTPTEELRWFDLDGLRVFDRDGRSTKLPHETTREDPLSYPYCPRCAQRLDVPSL